MKRLFFSVILFLITLGQPLMATSSENSSLAGEWKFCPTQSYQPALELALESCYVINIPGAWEAAVPDYDGFGLLTREFRVNQNLDTNLFGFAVSRLRDADKTFINGHLIGETGEFPPDFQKAVLYSRLYQIPNEVLKFDGINRISIWVYNDARPGGMTQGVPVIGDYYKLLEKQTSENYQILTFIVMLIIFTLFHLIHSYFHKYSKDYLIFSLFTATWAIYLFTFGEFGRLTGLSLNTLFRLNVALFFATFYLFPIFIFTFFGQKPGIYIKLMLYSSLAMIPVCFILPEPGMVYLPLEVIEVLTIPVLILLARFLYLCVKKKLPYAKSFVALTLVYAIFGGLDILIDITNINILDNAWLFGPWALVIFSLMLTVLIAHKTFHYYQDSIIDGLTSALRRDEFTSRLDNEIIRAERENHYVLVVMIDMDNFKAINDSYGHTQGDQVLVQVTQALKSELRLFDHVGRYGGDEFCICATFKNQSESKVFVKRLHEKICSLYFDAKGQRISISSTFGAVVKSPDTTNNASELIEQADGLLVSAKTDQKGQVLWRLPIISSSS
jgi:diguanylate cyclase (GGDEF)-like protein